MGLAGQSTVETFKNYNPASKEKQKRKGRPFDSALNRTHFGI